MKNKGFTLIELLVVIAIIGILSSVVLASLNSARSKGQDTSVKSNLANARAEAEMFYDTSSSYDGVCAISGTNIIGDSVTAAAKANASTNTYTVSDTSDGSASTAICHDSSSGWAAMAPLKSPATSGNQWCVDSTGASKEVAATALNTDNDVTCD